MDETLTVASQAIADGHMDVARQLLMGVVRTPAGAQSGRAWHLLSLTLSDAAQRADCKRRASALGFIPTPAPIASVFTEAAPAPFAPAPRQATSPAPATMQAPEPTLVSNSGPAAPVGGLVVPPVRRGVPFVGLAVAGVVLTLLIVGGVVLNQRTPAAQNSTAASSPTVAPAAQPTAPTEVNLEPLLIQENDLPTGYGPGQISDIDPGAFKEMPVASRQIFQQVERDGKTNGNIAVFVYDTVAAATAAFPVGIRLAVGNVGKPAPGVGDESQMHIENRLLSGTTIQFVSIAFRRCSTVVAFTFGDMKDERAAVSYAKRLDARLKTAVCG